MEKQFTETIHSDFLIHWTGKDIEEDYQTKWNVESPSKIGDDKIINAYLKRLKNILQYGLWMTKDDKPEILEVNNQKLEKPLVPRTCFTELKLSEARKHAENFGRLGIGVKRYFLFDRMGSPLIYIQFKTENIFFSPYTDWFDKSKKEYELLSFFKHMCSERPLTYDLFSESEWRIIFSENIKKILIDKGHADVLRLFIDPKNSHDQQIKKFYSSLQDKKPEYLIPLDWWFSIIIFPSHEVKIAADNDQEIQKLIEEVKKNPPRTGCPDTERQMKPIEVDLDACSHF